VVPDRAQQFDHRRRPARGVGAGPALEQLRARGAAVVGVEGDRRDEVAAAADLDDLEEFDLEAGRVDCAVLVGPCKHHALEQEAVAGCGENGARETRLRRSDQTIVRHEQVATPAEEGVAAAVLEDERRREQGLDGLEVPCRDGLSPGVIDPPRSRASRIYLAPDIRLGPWFMLTLDAMAGCWQGNRCPRDRAP
jgi:hypothetical protein